MTSFSPFRAFFIAIFWFCFFGKGALANDTEGGASSSDSATVSDLSAERKELWEKACPLTRLVASSVRLAEAAGAIIKGVMENGKLNAVDKDRTGELNDWQTDADRLAQICIVDSLRKKFGEKLTIIGEENIPPSSAFSAEQLQSLPNPHHLHIFGKESVTTAEASLEVLRKDEKVPKESRSIKLEDIVVWVDPLDGTSGFVTANRQTEVEKAQHPLDGSSRFVTANEVEKAQLLRQVTVLIGITYQGRPVAGVVHQPFYDGQTASGSVPNGRTVWSIVGVGTFGLNANLDRTDAQKPRVGVTTASSRKDETLEKALKALKTSKLIDGWKRVGGAGFKVLRVLEDSVAYVFPSPATKKWDTAAPEALLLAAGGKLTDLSGREINYASNVQRENSGGLLATAPGVDHKRFVDAIPQDVKDKLPETVVTDDSLPETDVTDDPRGKV